MRILFVHSAAAFSTYDVARGHLAALQRLGHEVQVYHTGSRFDYHASALRSVNPALADDVTLVSKLASDGIAVEAMYFEPDLVLIASGRCLHANALYLLRKMRVPTAVLFTESPYEDVEQAEWAATYPTMQCLCNDTFSARQRGWPAISHAFDPEIHRPVAADPDDVCDVLIVGTGWTERVRLLEAVDWTGITLRIRGLWPQITADSPLAPCYVEGCVDNDKLPRLYASARICLNFHRAHPQAESLNPRAFELAACGAFQLSDPRPELFRVFASAVPTFTDAASLQAQVRYFLAHDAERRALAARQAEAVQGHTFDARAAELLAHVTMTTATVGASSTVTT
jgi:spore maturation protein CgeB